MLGRELDQRVLCMNGPEAAQTGEEAEDQVLGDEPPREQTDDRSDLATDDRAHADADCAPEGCAGDCAEKKECDLPAVEGEVDAAAGEARVTDPEAEPSAEDSENRPGEDARSDLGSKDARASRREQERRPDRPVPVLARHRHDPGKGGEHAREISHAEQVALISGRDEMRRLGEQACKQREEENDPDHPQHHADCRTRRPDFQELRPKLAGHAALSSVSPRKTSSSEEPSLTSSWIGTFAAKAMSPTCSLVVPYTSTVSFSPALN